MHKIPDDLKIDFDSKIWPFWRNHAKVLPHWFVRFGYLDNGETFCRFIGLCEIFGGIGVLLPLGWCSDAANLGLIGVMAAAIINHIALEDPYHKLFIATIITVLLVIRFVWQPSPYFLTKPKPIKTKTK